MTEPSPLSFFGPGLDPGPSFVELVRQVRPSILPGRGLDTVTRDGVPFLASDVPHGTTVLAIRYAGGVVMAGDRRATAGYTIANRRIEKVFPADELSGVAIAGAAGPAVELVKLFQVQLEHYEKVQGDTLSLEGKANQLAQLVRANLPAAMQGFVVVPLFAGYDARRAVGRVFSYDVTGGRYEEADYTSQGSGSVHARNWVKATWREGMTADETTVLAIRALFAAADEDVATGGPDLVRRIFPTIARIDGDGYQELDEATIESLAQDALTGPERGGERVMTMPFYVSPEQVMKDRADYARKGIARGRSLVALECEAGVLIVADNAQRTLSKISEIYDRIAFAAVGKYNEFQLLRVAGVRHADLKGYSYSREDVSAKELANAYAQTLGQIFTHEMKPYEVELLVAEVGPDPAHDAMYHVLYDGVVLDEQDHAVLGGNAESISETLASEFQAGMSLTAALQLGARVLAPDGDPLGPEQLEVALLDRTRARRAFRRLRNGELESLLASS